ncbi:MAG: ThuA domain-containing protein [Opitutales bacterium]|nr:ThuA domain-containing protein [Opitutales bacterium]
MKNTPVKLMTALLAVFLFITGLTASEPIKVLIIDGQNNHNVWPKSTFMMKRYLEETGKFTVDIYRSQYMWRSDVWLKEYPLNDGKTYKELSDPKTDPEFLPNFSDYACVISNFGWRAAPWPEKTQDAFEAYVSDGGGFISVHAADNCFPEWKAYNEMIGLGGWGGRTEKDGPYVYFNEEEVEVRDHSPGRGGSHGRRHEFQVTVRAEHPITKDMPKVWMHTPDECYDRLRGPALNMTILATAYSFTELGGTGRHEPVMMAVDYGKGRIFHTTLGHDDYSFECVGFITSLQRGVEWAATGDVTIPIPNDFPRPNGARVRKFVKTSCCE